MTLDLLTQNLNKSSSYGDTYYHQVEVLFLSWF